VHVQAPIGTYTGWNLGRKDRFEDGFCSLQGSFVPFAKTKAERDATGDPRRSLEERYPTKDAYAAAVKTAADGLVAQRLLLPADAKMLVDQAATEGVRMGP
jgi:Alpha/beta hydrolase domain